MDWTNATGRKITIQEGDITRIAVDAMGGDYAPLEIVAGCVQSATRLPKLTRLVLVGDRATVALHQLEDVGRAGLDADAISGAGCLVDHVRGSNAAPLTAP